MPFSGTGLHLIVEYGSLARYSSSSFHLPLSHARASSVVEFILPFCRKLIHFPRSNGPMIGTLPILTN
jgi:hypothetical protein